MHHLSYAGIGSRETPAAVMGHIRQLAGQLANAGFLLRSGGADGADTAFEDGAREAGGAHEIFLPWKGFNGNTSPLFHISEDALRLASTLHPAWGDLGQGPKKLHARNCKQILGDALNDPVDFVLCWTADGCSHVSQRSVRTGGTGTAIALASRESIPVFNLANPGAVVELTQMLRSRGIQLSLEATPPQGQRGLF